METFVDPQQFQGTVYLAGGGQELGATRGFGRVGRDSYVAHRRPKRLLVRELCRNARRGLQAEHLKPAWAAVEAQVAPRCAQTACELRSLIERFKRVEDFRTGIGSYPLWSLLAIVALAYLCGGPRGQKDLEGCAPWRASDPRRRHSTRTDFHGANGAEHARRALRLVTSRNPSFKEPS